MFKLDIYFLLYAQLLHINVYYGDIVDLDFFGGVDEKSRFTIIVIFDLWKPC